MTVRTPSPCRSPLLIDMCCVWPSTFTLCKNNEYDLLRAGGNNRGKKLAPTFVWLERDHWDVRRKDCSNRLPRSASYRKNANDAFLFALLRSIQPEPAICCVDVIYCVILVGFDGQANVILTGRIAIAAIQLCDCG